MSVDVCIFFVVVICPESGWLAICQDRNLVLVLGLPCPLQKPDRWSVFQSWTCWYRKCSSSLGEKCVWVADVTSLLHPVTELSKNQLVHFRLSFSGLSPGSTPFFEETGELRRKQRIVSVFLLFIFTFDLKKRSLLKEMLKILFKNYLWSWF